jgi:hypothetical protein
MNEGRKIEATPAELARLSDAARPGPWRAYETVMADNFIVEESQGLLNGPGPVMGPSYDKATVEYVVALVNAHRDGILASYSSVQAVGALPKLIVIESPFAGDIEANIAYARRALTDSLARNEAPMASHLLYTQPGVLDDDHPDERALGIEAGLLWAARADLTVFYTDRGWSPGMMAARERCEAESRPWTERTIGA